jgi:hypothetical protein
MSGMQEVSKLLDDLISGSVDLASAKDTAKKIKDDIDGKKGETKIKTKAQPSESDASKQIDKLNAIQYGKDHGLIDDSEASDAAAGVLGGGDILLASSDAGFVPNAGSTEILSGSSWLSKYPTSNDVEDLESDFKTKVKKFIDALNDAGASITIQLPQDQKKERILCIGLGK